jgi:hypothetical protein
MCILKRKRKKSWTSTRGLVADDLIFILFNLLQDNGPKHQPENKISFFLSKNGYVLDNECQRHVFDYKIPNDGI